MTKENLRIVIINDDANDVELLRQSLVDESERRYLCEAYKTGREGIQACLATGISKPDCVIVDLHLPDMTGIDVLNALKDATGEVCFAVVLFIDSGNECKAATAALRGGAQDYIAKSWLTADGLACSVEHAIERFKLRERLRKQRDAIERRNREFNALIGNLPDIVILFDTNFRHVYINPAIERAYGLPPQAYLGKTSREMGMPAELCDFWESVLSEAIAGGREITFEYDAQSPIGPKCYQTRLVPQFSATGEVESILAVSTDVTEGKRAEEVFRAGEEHLRNVIDRLIAFVGVMTPDGILLESNKPALKVASLRPREVLGKPFEETYWWSYSSAVQADLRRAIDCAARGENVRYDEVIRIGEDRFMTIDFQISPLRDASGRVTHLISSGVDITERKRTEEEMRRIAAKERVRAVELQTVLRAAPAAIWISKDPECKRITGNPASYKLLRVPEKTNISATAGPDAAVVRTFQEFRGGVPIPPHELPMQLAATKGIESSGTELTIRFDDGDERHIFGNATPLRDPDGQVYGAISAFIDITTLKQAEEAVRVNEERFRLASEAVSGMIYDWDPRTGRIERSPGLLALTGYRPEEAEPTSEWWSERIAPEDLERVTTKTYESQLNRDTLYEMEYQVKHRNGYYRHVWDRARVVYDDQNRPARIVGYTIDITERVKGEEALRLADRRFRRFATSDIIGIVFSDLRGGLSFANDEYLRIIDYTREQFNESRPLWTELTPPEWIASDEKGIAEVRSSGSCLPYEKEYVRRDGSRTPVLIGYTLLDDSGDDVVAFVLDITERKRSEKALKDADRKKDEFLAMLAHELRNPLAAIRAAVHILVLKGPQQREFVWGREVIERQAKHLTRLIEDLLDVSRISTGKIQLKPVPIDLREIITRATESVWPIMNAKQHDLKAILPPRPLLTLGDPSRLEQVVSNILTNAAKYTDNNGNIIISCEQLGFSNVIRVRDNGIGIDEQMLPYVFDLYAQVDGKLARTLGGLGIGLTLVKMLVEMHGGRVSATSEGHGKGCEFVVSLPIYSEVSEPKGETAEGTKVLFDQAPSPLRPRVLVVDDNVDIATGLALLVETSGCEVKVAHEGTATLEIAREFQPAFVLLDIGMPGMSGYEIARAFRSDKALSQGTLVAISGFGQEDDREKARAAGFDYHLTKPVDLEQLLPILMNRSNVEDTRQDKKPV